MALAAGTRIGHYEILALAGAGGMGEVYRARDTRLQRDVALKLLPDQLATDAERCARLEREAQVLASLNHPHVAQVHGLERADGLSVIVMELVEGPTLADRIASAPAGLPLDDVVPIALQIVSALEAAHARGIVHRDLKPANIKITPDSQTKILDFGLATVDATVPAVTGAVNFTNSPTVMAATMPGVIMGTLAYMSPEQARGLAIDSRTDVWAFGCVLYEMLTGRQAFAGETPTDVVAKIVTTSPDWDRLPHQTPIAIRQLLRATLDRDPKKRLQHIGDARLFLEREMLANPLPEANTSSRSRWSGWPMRAAVASFFVAAVAGAYRLGNRPVAAAPTQVTHFTIRVPQSLPSQTFNSLALSRDGSRLAYVAGPERQIFVRDMSQLEASAIPGTDGAAWLAFAPNGNTITFVAGGHLSSVQTKGGPPQVLADADGAVGPPTPRWQTDGALWFAANGMLQRLPKTGGKPEVIAGGNGRSGEPPLFSPQLLPGGDRVLATDQRNRNMVAIDRKTRERRLLLEHVEAAQFVPSGVGAFGHLLYLDYRVGTLMAAAFNADTLQVYGDPVPVAEGIEGQTPFGSFSVSPTGTLAYVGRGASLSPRDSTLVWVEGKGVEHPSGPARPYIEEPRISPIDGSRVALVLQGNDAVDATDIWVYDLNTGSFTRITAEGRSFDPVWTPDGKRLIFFSGRGRNRATQSGGSDDSQTSVAGLMSKAADGTGATAVIASASEGVRFPYDVAADGMLLAGNVPDASLPFSRRLNRREPLMMMPLALAPSGATKPHLFRDSAAVMAGARFSPDSRWVAYEDSDSGAYEVYVVPYPGPGERQTVSAGGGTSPRWSADGRHLFYRNGDAMMVVDISAGPEFHAGKPRELFKMAGYTGYDVARDGRFLMIKATPSATPEPPSEIHVVLNWFDELRRRVPLPQ